ncbi:MAG TPA: hypothetical protein PKI21_11075, partial [Nitrospira sp.]|nr:hypothetical protein [Nitrospira sp.]
RLAPRDTTKSGGEEPSSGTRGSLLRETSHAATARPHSETSSSATPARMLTFQAGLTGGREDVVRPPPVTCRIQ